jgi:hypothetical protein
LQLILETAVSTPDQVQLLNNVQILLSKNPKHSTVKAIKIKPKMKPLLQVPPI